jgi:hypothetical protein
MTVIGVTETTDVTFVARVVLGGIVLVILKITGDGSGVTVYAPIGNIKSHHVGVIDAADGYNPAITYSGNIVTYAVAPLDDVSHFLFLYGTD